MSLFIPDIKTVTNHFPDPHLRSKDYVSITNGDFEYHEDYTTLVNTSWGASQIELVGMSSHENGWAVVDRTLRSLNPIDVIRGPDRLNDRITIDLVSITDDYNGPPFSGDTPPFEYKGQMVYPQWDGTPHESTSSFTYYEEFAPWDTTVTWHKAMQRTYSIGVDRGMLYLGEEGYPWSGLVSVSRDPSDGEFQKRYLDGVVFNIRVPTQDFSGTISCYTYPREFEELIGEVSIGDTAIRAHNQYAKPFNMVYRTYIGTGESMDRHYKLHFLYNVHAQHSGVSYDTVNDRPESSTFDFDIHAIPVAVPGLKPTSYFTIDSRDVNGVLLESLERALYGSDGSDPYLPTIEEIRDFLDT